jgi:hypothetical protein
MCRHGAYRGDGAFGQFCVVMPEQEAVLAITGGVETMQPVLDLVWETLLPAMGPTPLPKDRTDQEALEQKLAGLKLDPPVEPTQHYKPAFPARIYSLEENPLKFEAVTFDFHGDEAEVQFLRARTEERILVGQGSWTPGRIKLLDRYSSRVVSSGRWTSADTYEMTLRFYEMPYYLTVTCRFVDNRVTMQFQQNVSFGPILFPPIEGKQV